VPLFASTSFGSIDSGTSFSPRASLLVETRAFSSGREQHLAGPRTLTPLASRLEER
jgi:hypothetical protein